MTELSWKTRPFLLLLLVAPGLVIGCKSQPEPADESDTRVAESGKTTGSSEEESDSAGAQSAAEGRAERVSGKSARQAVVSLEETLGEFSKEGTGAVDWSSLLGSTPHVLVAEAYQNAKIETHTDVASFEHALDKFRADGLCVPSLIDCHAGCCAFETSMSDSCAHHGVSVTQACFVESDRGLEMSELWLQCPFDYQASIESSADECLKLSVQGAGAGEHACRPPVRHIFMVENHCEASFSVSLPQVQDDPNLKVYALDSCDRLECSYDPKATLGGKPIDIDIRLALEPKAPKQSSFQAHAGARGYKN